MTGQIMCSGACTDPRYDPRNCGACGTACPSGQACRTGVCGACVAPEILCPGSYCSNVNTDPGNCGACGRSCPAGSTRCTLGVCS